MSRKKRNLVFWSLSFQNKQDKDEVKFDRKLFLSLMKELKTKIKNETVLIDNDEVNHVAVMLKSINKTPSAWRYRVVFKSCKYNHSPDYMSVEDGTETPTQKAMNQGESELTHILMCIQETEVICIFEERRSGVNFGRVVDYLNDAGKEHLTVEGKQYCLRAMYIPIADFKDEIKNAKRIKAAELVVDKKTLGSSTFNLTAIGENTIRNEVNIVYKADIGKGIKKSSIVALCDLVQPGSEIQKMRVDIVDSMNNEVALAVLSANQRKCKVDVELVKKSGIVSSDSIFAQMESVLKEYLDERKR